MADNGETVRIGKRCYVGNLAWKTSWQDLKDKFRECGSVVYANVMRSEDGEFCTHFGTGTEGTLNRSFRSQHALHARAQRSGLERYVWALRRGTRGSQKAVHQTLV
jgi:hypothetical protein